MWKKLTLFCAALFMVISSFFMNIPQASGQEVSQTEKENAGAMVQDELNIDYTDLTESETNTYLETVTSQKIFQENAKSSIDNYEAYNVKYNDLEGIEMQTVAGSFENGDEFMALFEEGELFLTSVVNINESEDKASVTYISKGEFETEEYSLSEMEAEQNEKYLNIENEIAVAKNDMQNSQISPETDGVQALGIGSTIENNLSDNQIRILCGIAGSAGCTVACIGFLAIPVGGIAVASICRFVCQGAFTSQLCNPEDLD